MKPYYDQDGVTLYHGGAADVLRGLPSGSVRCCVTSPPYWGGLRDYGNTDQMGLERDPAEYVARLVEVFREVRRLLAEDGTLWLNVGDVFAASGKGGGGAAGKRSSWDTVRDRKGFRMPPASYKMKDLTLMPFQLADALRRDGWYLRQTVVWRKPSAVEPKRADRPSTPHEYVFLLSKSKHYRCRNPGRRWWGSSVWDIASDVSASHPATMPIELASRCIACSTDMGDTAIDPFVGYGTTADAAKQMGRLAVGCDLEATYLDLAISRLSQGMLNFTD